MHSRLQFADAFIDNDFYKDELKINGILPTEVKYENNIDRMTCKATPRQIERIISGSIYKFELYYDAEQEDEIEDDIKNIKLGLDLLESDYIGGNGSRGYGKIKFDDLHLDCITKNMSDKIDNFKKIIENRGE